MTLFISLLVLIAQGSALPFLSRNATLITR